MSCQQLRVSSHVFSSYCHVRICHRWRTWTVTHASTCLSSGDDACFTISSKFRKHAHLLGNTTLYSRAYHLKLPSHSAIRNVSSWPRLMPSCFCRGLSLRGCEDIDDTAVLILSKYTARSDLSQQLSSLSVAPSSTPDGSHPAVHNPGRAVTAVGPSIRNVSLQRTVLSNSLQSVCQAAAPKSPHQQPVLDPESSAKQTQGSRSARWEVQQHSSSIDTGELCFHVHCVHHLSGVML